MGRGRQKAKQTKIARKLKYLTTDTDYDELEKELRHHDDEEVMTETVEVDENIADSDIAVDTVAQESTPQDLDDYAAWAAEAAKRAEEQKPATKAPVHKPFPKMPIPGIKPHPKAPKTQD
ncbi:DUF3073 domain-containing protein [Alloscardovia venturai]|uniref:DUF3073 domain-containing protein n=1 Tax=Alloscardovia venturai TaxID=1769421 RepID=A0ABW2Y4B3_9BIFI